MTYLILIENKSLWEVYTHYANKDHSKAIKEYNYLRSLGKNVRLIEVQ